MAKSALHLFACRQLTAGAACPSKKQVQTALCLCDSIAADYSGNLLVTAALSFWWHPRDCCEFLAVDETLECRPNSGGISDNLDNVSHGPDLASAPLGRHAITVQLYSFSDLRRLPIRPFVASGVRMTLTEEKKIMRRVTQVY
jgi:hypothetical protein